MVALQTQVDSVQIVMALGVVNVFLILLVVRLAATEVVMEAKAVLPVRAIADRAPPRALHRLLHLARLLHLQHQVIILTLEVTENIPVSLRAAGLQI
jgi:hypothetical protein